INRHSEIKRKKIRTLVHLSFSLLLLVVILGFNAISNESVVVAVFTVAGYTYGPILGLFVFGMFSKRPVKDKWVPLVAILAPLISYFISRYSEVLFWGYRFGFEILILNGMLTFIGLYILSKRTKN